jgi:hypothetical protein
MSNPSTTLKTKKWNPQLDDVSTTPKQQLTPLEDQNKPGVSWSFYLLAVFLIVVSSANSVASKIVSVPYGGYSFFLGLWNSLAYVVVYFVILLLRLTVLGLTSWDQIKHVWSVQPAQEGLGPWGFFGELLRRLPHVCLVAFKLVLFLLFFRCY